MLRDDERIRPAARRADVRVRTRSAPTPYRVPRSLDIRPPRRSLKPFAYALVIALVLGGAGYLAADRFLGPGVDASVVGADADSGPLGAARIMAPAEIRSSAPGFVSTLRGLVDDATALTANGEPIAIEPGGQFRIYLPQGLAGVELAATDATGQVTTMDVVVTDAPTASTYPETVGVHIRAPDWTNPEIREAVLELARTGQINAVQLDIKDEAGEIGYDSDVQLASESGADASAYYDPREALDQLHALGVRVIGRVVCFLDPIVAQWAWQNGDRDLVVQNANGSGPLANNYGSAAFTNLANQEIRQYQIDLSIEAAQLGFDEILYDYVRRPEGELSEMRFPGLDVPPEVSVATFVADTNRLLEPDGIELGVSVFGISASRPLPTAQDVSLLAPNVDYVAPMVYPSHWGSGEYGVANPNGQPGEIVAASLGDFQRLIAGSGAAMVPWLQDFSYGGVEYGVDEVRAQIDASYATGSAGFLLWNSGSVYTTDALTPRFTNTPED